MTTSPSGTTRRLTVLVAAAGVAVLIGACGMFGSGGTAATSSTAAPIGTTAAPTTPPPAPTTGSDLPAGWTLCQNPTRGSSMGYPTPWFTTSLNAAEKCSQFHPSTFTIPVAGEYPLTALNAVQSTESVATYVAGAVDSAYHSSATHSATSVNGRSAEKFETVTNGEGLYEAGLRMYGYAINRDGRAFVVWTSAPAGESRYAAWKAIVDQAVLTLRFDH